jgi:hypothetical protein
MGCSNSLCLMYCSTGFAHCGGGDPLAAEIDADGCETHVLSDPDNCGECGNVCPDGTTCQEGTCG